MQITIEDKSRKITIQDFSEYGGLNLALSEDGTFNVSDFFNNLTMSGSLKDIETNSMRFVNIHNEIVKKTNEIGIGID